MSDAPAVKRPRGRPKGSKGNRKRDTGPARSASPTVRALFAAISRRGLSVKYDVAVPTGIICASLSNYRCGRNTPNILAVEEIAAALGYRLVLHPLSIPSTDTGLTADNRSE